MTPPTQSTVLLRRRHRAQQAMWFRVLLGVSLVGVLGLVKVHLRGQVIEAQFELEKSRASAAQMRQDIQALRLRADELSSPDRIESVARRDLGMVRPARVVFIEKSRPQDGAVAVNSGGGAEARP